MRKDFMETLISVAIDIVALLSVSAIVVFVVFFGGERYTKYKIYKSNEYTLHHWELKHADFVLGDDHHRFYTITCRIQAMVTYKGNEYVITADLHEYTRTKIKAQRFLSILRKGGTRSNRIVTKFIRTELYNIELDLINKGVEIND